MGPGFTKKTKEILAKSAAYKCSNPSCGVLTVGPNSQRDKVTSLGEAAHIYGARPTSARYNTDMTNSSRAEITNGIWLCSNCHNKIDDDEGTYPADLLFRWRAQHETKIAAELGDPEAEIRSEQDQARLSSFALYPPIIKRIVIDKPPCWEWRLTAELMRHLNGPELRRMEDLRNGLYSSRSIHMDDDDMPEWVSERCREMEALIEPLSNLIPRLNHAWGAEGEEGDAEEILHITILIRDALSRAVDHEEDLYFTIVSERGARVVEMLKDAVGRQLAHFQNIPGKLDEIVDLALSREETGYDEPLVIKHDIVFELPDNWAKDLNREMRKLARSLGMKPHTNEHSSASGCLAAFLIGAFIFFVVQAIS